jgi:hypothetical protein
LAPTKIKGNDSGTLARFCGAGGLLVNFDVAHFFFGEVHGESRLTFPASFSERQPFLLV